MENKARHPIQPKTPSSCHQIPPHLFPPDVIPPNHLHCTFSTIAPMMAALPLFLSLCLRNRENKQFFSRTNSYLKIVLQREHSVKNALCALIEIMSRRRVHEVLLVIFYVGEPLSITKKANTSYLRKQVPCCSNNSRYVYMQKSSSVSLQIRTIPWSERPWSEMGLIQGYRCSLIFETA